MAVAVGAAPAFAQGGPVLTDPMSVRRLADLTSEPQLAPNISLPGTQGTAELNGRLYFLAARNGDSPGSTVQELWVTDGTSVGTRSVQEELLPSGTSIGLGSLRATAHRLFFTATSPETGLELWTSDGTREGTRITRELNPGWSDGVSPLTPLFVFGDTVLFAPASTSRTAFDLWKSDGTEAGTVPVKDIHPGLTSADVNGFARVGDTVFFNARNAQGIELWRTDGTEAGTLLVRDIYPGAGDSLPWNLTAVGSTLYFTANDGSQRGRSLWKSDGTEAGTVRIKDFNTAATSLMPTHLGALGDMLIFVVSSTEQASELWRTDGTEAGTQLLTQLPSAMLNSYSGQFSVPAGNRLYLVAKGAQLGDSVWVTDGTKAGTTRLPSPAAYGHESVRGVTAWEDGLAFTLMTPGRAHELWRTNGTPAGTSRLARLPSGNTFEPAPGLVSFQGALLTTSGDPWTHRALWRMEREDAAPTFVCPATQDVPSNLPWGTVVHNLVPAMVGHQGPFTIRSTAPEGSVLPLYQPVPVHYQYEDARGRIAACVITMTSRDMQAPSFESCPTGLDVGTRSPQGHTFFYPNAAVKDETSDVLITYSPENGSVLPLGTTVVTMTAKDSAGNASTCSFPVTVRDGQAPGAACKVSEVRVEAEGPQGAHAYWPEATPTDSISAQVSVTSTHASGDLFPLGLTRVQVTSVDEAGNSTTCEIQVRVRDSRPPLLTCPQDQTLTTAVMSGTRAEYPFASAEDAVSAAELSYSPVVGTPLAPGLHAVQVTAIDEAGNASLCNFHVTVQYDPTSDMRQGLGCSVGGDSSSALGWVALLALAWTVSRRLKDGSPRA
ncbi:HYR domain-containing protein [Corallococcus aberystwythensis]|uniref:HYR domain-containing protein n=1 Tax=Corallococcus aberystwythensis TaxID=2316722 RepID=A0A3A8Q9C8_9BACT|nr:HYR domain-containing protein [Corallococcus aberystwythensis]